MTPDADLLEEALAAVAISAELMQAAAARPFSEYTQGYLVGLADVVDALELQMQVRRA